MPMKIGGYVCACGMNEIVNSLFIITMLHTCMYFESKCTHTFIFFYDIRTAGGCCFYLDLFINKPSTSDSHTE